MWSG
jgi:hypothetical protein